MEKLKRKKIIIGSIYLTLFLLIALGFYLRFKPAPSCFDKAKNQNEEGIDCGGICQKECGKIGIQELIVERTGAVFAGISGKYDFYALVTNPNAIFGSKKFNYSINFKDSAGQVIASKNGSGFILPKEKKYIIESNIESLLGAPASVDFKLNDSDWIEFGDYYEKPDIQVVNKKYDRISGGLGFSEATGLLKNKSSYDFDLIKVQIILKDAGEIIALNSTQMRTINSGEERDFKVSWPSGFPGDPNSLEVQTEVDIFNSDTFLKKFYKAEKFQEF